MNKKRFLKNCKNIIFVKKKALSEKSINAKINNGGKFDKKRLQTYE